MGSHGAQLGLDLETGAGSGPSGAYRAPLLWVFIVQLPSGAHREPLSGCVRCTPAQGAYRAPGAATELCERAETARHALASLPLPPTSLTTSLLKPNFRRLVNLMPPPFRLHKLNNIQNI